MRNFYLIVYDVVNNKRRSKIARHLEAVGERVQYSVFEVYLNEKEIKKLEKTLLDIVKKEEDSIRFYFLCATCKAKVKIAGKGVLTPAPNVTIV